MAIVMCQRCDRVVDLDWNSEAIEWFDDEPVCDNCLTEEELDKIEEDEVRDANR